jgi:hypothetical protein
MGNVDTGYRSSLKGRLLFIQRDIEQLQKEEVLLRDLIVLYGDTPPREDVKICPKEIIHSPVTRIIKKEKSPPIQLKEEEIISEIHPVVRVKPTRAGLIVATAVKLLYNREWVKAGEVLDNLPEEIKDTTVTDVALALSNETLKVGFKRLKRVMRGAYGLSEPEEVIQNSSME